MGDEILTEEARFVRYRTVLINLLRVLRPLRELLLDIVARDARTDLTLSVIVGDEIVFEAGRRDRRSSCITLISESALSDTCERCRLALAAKGRNAFSSLAWCPWGLRHAIAPIAVGGMELGMVVCGPMRIQDDAEEEEGVKIATQAIADFHLSESGVAILRQRKTIPTVSVERSRAIAELAGYFAEVTSSYIAEAPSADFADAGELINYFGQFIAESLSRATESGNPNRFWKDAKRVLERTMGPLDLEAVVVLFSAGAPPVPVASCGVTLDSWDPHSALSLVTRTAGRSGLIGEISLSDPRAKECPVCRAVSHKLRNADLVVYLAAPFFADRCVEVIAFPRRPPSPEQRLGGPHKRRLFSILVGELVNSLIQIDRIKHVEDILQKQKRFLLDVSHEMNQPLHGMMADCDNLLSSEFPPERKARVLRFFPHRIRYFSMLLRSLEYAARGGEGLISSLRPNPQAVPLTRLLIECSVVLQGYAAEKWLNISIDTASTDRIGEVYIDRDHLMLAMTNILSNAVKYSFPKTSVTVTAEEASEAKQVTILVRNLGIELPREQWETVFDRGVRGAPAKKFSQSGLGIGLFVTRSIARQMGGNAYVKDSFPSGAFYKGFQQYCTTIALSIPKKLSEL